MSNKMLNAVAHLGIWLIWLLQQLNISRPYQN